MPRWNELVKAFQRGAAHQEAHKWKKARTFGTVSIRVAGQDTPAIINKSDFNDKTQQLDTERTQKAAPAKAEPVKTDPVKPATDKPATVTVLC